MAIFYEIVRVEHVERTWQQWRTSAQEGSDEAFWRMLVRDPTVDGDALYGVAAQIYGFEELTINRLRAQALISDIAATFSEDQWRHMFDLHVVPVAVGEDPRTGHARLIFVTHDPTRPAVTRLLQSFGLDSFELHYAVLSQINELFAEIIGADQEALLASPATENAIADFQLGPESVSANADESPPELDPKSLVEWFESMLIATYRARATEAHLFINDARELEIHFRVDGILRLWRKETALHPEGVLAYITDKVIKVDNFDPDIQMEVRFQRWINRDLTLFHLCIRPASGINKLSAATVILRVLGHRETSAEGMGPWKSH